MIGLFRRINAVEGPIHGLAITDGFALAPPGGTPFASLEQDAGLFIPPAARWTMSDESRAARQAGQENPPAEGPNPSNRHELDPDDSNRFGPDAPNVRADDPPGGQTPPTAPPVLPSRYPLDHGDFAPDEG